MIMDEIIINPDSKLGSELGFTSENFGGFLTLHQGIGILSLSVIESKHPNQGNVHRLLKKIKKKGYSMDAVIISDRMHSILDRFGFMGGKDYMFYANPKQYNALESRMIFDVLKAQVQANKV